MAIILDSSTRNDVSATLATSEDVYVISDRELTCPCITINDRFNIALFSSIIETTALSWPVIVCCLNEEMGQFIMDTLEYHHCNYLKKDITAFDYSQAAQEAMSLVQDEEQFHTYQLSRDMNRLLTKLEENVEEVSTGYSNLDELMGGGFNEGRLYVIGAIPSLGKSTLSLNIAANIAEAGKDVLIFSLEMSREELIIKLLVRGSVILANGESQYFPNFNDIIRHRLTQDKLDMLSKASNEFAEGIGKKISVVSEFNKIGLDEIEKHVSRYAERGIKPVVMIDFMQIMKPQGNGSEKQIMDRNISGLKRISQNYGITIWGISSLNRMSYLEEVAFESFKETGGIETWSDVILGMHLYVPERKDSAWTRGKAIGTEEKRRILEAAKAAYPRKIELVALKNRTYEFGRRCYFDYYSKYEIFKEAAEPKEEITNENN